ncbi:MAG: iron-containing alcohol dehydrogenase [Synergistaceae bacterium]|nr:iron-containing alcohol dehydrogenase [Synergistota bacterium]NLM70734.1 iron-containing alcohol dehydrogenase [Synergistaceae bacterium]
MLGGFALRKFVAPEILFGEGAMEYAGQYAHNLGGTRVFIATDPGLIEAGWLDRVVENLRQERLDCVVFSDIRPNPTVSMVMSGAEVYDEEDCDLVLALGGGSPMDCAKAIAAVHANGSHVLEFVGIDRIPNPSPPVICIPSTSGSAADVSQFSIIKDDDTKVKCAIISKSMVPDLSLTDPRITVTMDRGLTAATGLDALTHAVEAYVSRASSNLTDLHALHAIRLVVEHLPRVLDDLSDMACRTGMTLASMHAGLAFSNAGLGVVHALSHSLGGLLDLPHGECNSLLLRYGVERNYTAAPGRFVEILRALGGGETATDPLDELLNRLDDLRSNAGVPGRLRELGLSLEQLPLLAKSAAEDPCMVTNPLPLTENDLESLLRNAY